MPHDKRAISIIILAGGGREGEKIKQRLNLCFEFEIFPRPEYANWIRKATRAQHPIVPRHGPTCIQYITENIEYSQ